MNLFGYDGKPETCLWCGRKLRHQYDTKRKPGRLRKPKRCAHCGCTGLMPLDDEYNAFECPGCHAWIHADRVRHVVSRTQVSKYPGDSRSKGHFCSLRCGFWFGETLAEHGRRLTKGGETK